MELSNDLVSQFVKVTKDEVEEKQETTVYGTIAVDGENAYVQLDGSQLLTPIASTVSIRDGDRVTVMIKDHSATVTGNLSDNAANETDLEGKTDSDSIIATINTSGENAVISGTKIDITGKVTFNSFGSEVSQWKDSVYTTDDDVLTSSDASDFLTSSDVGSSGTTTIDGGRILTGTIGAARLAVSDIFAQNITATGNIDFSNDNYILSTVRGTKITSSNISDYFTVSNSSYYFAGNTSGTFKSNNKNVNSSTAQTTLTALSSGNIIFNYTYSSESNYDKFYVIHNGTNIINGLSGTGAGSKSISFSAGDTIIFKYTKDTSTHSNNDECTIYNMYVNSYFTLRAINNSAKILADNDLLLRGEQGVQIISAIDDIDLDAANQITMSGGSNGVFILPGSDDEDELVSPYGNLYRVLTTADISDIVSRASSGPTIAAGIALVNYGTSITKTTISFGKTFTSKPAIITSQDFDSINIKILRNDKYTTFTDDEDEKNDYPNDVTRSKFRVRIAPLSSSGTRAIGWIAIEEI